MRKYLLEIAIGFLTLGFVLALGVEFFSITNLVGIEWRILSIMVMVTVYITITAIALVTNTRRPAGIDPNKKTDNDPFGMTTDELWHEGMPDRRSKKRRETDQAHADAALRLIKHFEQADEERPVPTKTPDWALELKQLHAPEETDDSDT
jgi:hypothetical protein